MTKASSIADHMSTRVVVFRMPSLRAEFASVAMRRALLAEALGMFLFVFLAAGAAVATAGVVAERLSASQVLVLALAHARAFGLAVAGAAALSGGHLNPAITLAAMVARRMSAARAVMYMMAQMIGATAAIVLLKMVVPNALTNGLGLHTLGARVTPEAAVVVEMVLTCALVMAFFATSTYQRHLMPMALGATVLLAHLFGMGLTGPSMNPARSFGPALVTGMWTGQWVYWVGPLMGGVLAAIMWENGLGGTKDS
jgi:MIP family channel proteins